MAGSFNNNKQEVIHEIDHSDFDSDISGNEAGYPPQVPPELQASNADAFGQNGQMPLGAYGRVGLPERPVIFGGVHPGNENQLIYGEAAAGLGVVAIHVVNPPRSLHGMDGNIAREEHLLPQSVEELLFQESVEEPLFLVLVEVPASREIEFDVNQFDLDQEIISQYVPLDQLQEDFDYSNIWG